MHVPLTKTTENWENYIDVPQTCECLSEATLSTLKMWANRTVYFE